MTCVTRLQLLRGTTAERVAMIPLAGELVYDTETKQVYIGDGTTAGGKLPAASTQEYFENVSKNIKSWNTAINYLSGDISSIVYTDGVYTIIKTFNYTSGILSSLVLSGDTPTGINLTKTFNYSGSDIVGWSYS